VILYCNDAAVAEQARALGVPVALEPLGGDVAVHDAVRFARALGRDRPDALIVGTFKKMWLAALAARLAGVRRVIARIGLESDTPRNAKYRWVMSRWIDAIVLTADAPRAEYRRALPAFDPARVLTIRTAVVPPVVTRSREEMRRELGLPLDAPVIGAVARLAAQKRFDRLLDAMAELPGDVHCVLVGEGAEREALEERARALGLEHRVRFTGRREDVGNVLTALDVFVISSDREGLSNSMLEALAVGVPVVSTAVSGARDALEPLADGSAPGEIVPLDSGAIAAALRRLLDDAMLRRRMSRAALARVRERFDFGEMLSWWERVLRE
jgi:glycosyltransferase involved in cell wall biosynthesis